MADLKISQLTDGGDAQAADEYVVARGAGNNRIDGASVAAAATKVGTITTGTWQGSQISDTYLATISTAGKVSNSATTATDANTNNAIVARDGTGSFTVGGIKFGADVAISRGAADRLDLSGGDSLNLVSGSYQIGGTNVLTSTTLGVGITASSLTSVGTLTALAVSGDVTIADKIVHDGDTNCAIRFPAADVISFETAGAERCRVTDGGHFLVNATTLTIGTSTQAFFVYPQGDIRVYRSSDTVGVFSRMNNDGTIISLRQANTEEGTISVAGTTVSYNGGHLARWSQSADGTRIDGLLKGTVLSNLDQMCEWKSVTFTITTTNPDGQPETAEVVEPYDGPANPGDVIEWEYNGQMIQATVILNDNEQLNCMKVSDVEGDPNVAGVFVNYDERGEFAFDMNIAMTGDMIIRIAQGTTVQRGDLLMSAGDGTAKPQGDDIVRGKTIAKVTSTHVTCTYPDGSYCVPCVLMAC